MTTPAETPPAKKRIHGAWYALVALPGILAIVVFATHIPKLIHGFTNLRLPTFEAGTHEVELDAGENTIYVEGDSSGGETVALASLRCTVRDPRGTELALEKTSGFESYTVSSFTGVAQYDVQIPSKGIYTVDCTPDAPARFGIGVGFPFLSVVWLLLAMFLALPLTGVTGYIVHRIRNGKRKTARIT
jgi:hypothetical protein